MEHELEIRIHLAWFLFINSRGISSKEADAIMVRSAMILPL